MDNHPLGGWALVICNPIAGQGRGTKLLSLVNRELQANEVRFIAAMTRRRGHAASLARSATLAGCSAVIVIGGDGTFFEAVNGVMNLVEPESAMGANGVALGLIQAGRGSDFGRSAGIPSDPQVAISRILEGRTAPVDLGHVRYRSFDGTLRGRYFANAAGLGFDGEVALRANKGPRVMGGTMTYLSSLLATLWAYRNKRVEVVVNEDEAWHARVNSIVVANGQYFGGGMRIAPEAQLADGELDLAVLGNLGKLDLILNVPRVYEGSHVTHPKFSMMRARRVEVRSPDRMLLQADGEVLGLAPAVFSSVPSALRLIV